MNKSDVISAYQTYLGRAPEDQNVIDARLASSLDAEGLRDELVGSREYLANGMLVRPSSYATFYSWKPKAPKVVVFGNCQGPNIARMIAAICQSDISISAFEIMSIAGLREEIAAAVEAADFIFTCKTYSPDYADLTPDRLRGASKARVIEYSPIYFGGLHPDLCYIGGQQDRVHSPVGDYNSKIVFGSFAKGLSWEDCLKQFSDENYRKIGYYAAFERSREEWRNREYALDYDRVTFYNWFFQNIRSRPLLMSVNHPSAALLIEMARAFCQAINFKYATVHENTVPNLLMNNVIWPIADEIAAEHGISYSTGYTYWYSGIPVSLRDFIWRSYQKYSLIKPEEIQRLAAANNLL